MSLPGASSLKSDLLSLPTTADKAAGIQAFVGKIADYMENVQAGPTGTPGIFTFNRSAMVAILMTQGNVSNSSWISTFVSAWQSGVNGGSTVPATVSDPSWIGSGSKDINTLPAVPATIPTVSAAAAILSAGLASASPTNDPPMPIAQAIHDATLAFQFTCIGLGPPPGLAPIPKVFSAQ